jgi:hypothetical protein
MTFPTHLASLDLLQGQSSSLPRHHLGHWEALVVDGLDGGRLEGAITYVRPCDTSTRVKM